MAMNAITIRHDKYGRTLVTNHAPGQSRVGIISRNGDSYHFVPTVNYGETAVRGGRMFSTLAGAVRVAKRFVTA